jgi:hypothetical protein
MAVPGAIFLISFSVLSAGVAGAIIGTFFIGFKTLPSILAFAGLHSIGGVIIISRRITSAVLKRS